MFSKAVDSVTMAASVHDTQEPNRTPFPPRRPSPSPSTYRKPCTQCSTPADVLVRCQTDASGSWHFICPGKCWKQVSGGVVDGDEAHPYYRYGGMWKNKHAGVSAKMKGKKKAKTKRKTGGEPRGDQSFLTEMEG